MLSTGIATHHHGPVAFSPRPFAFWVHDPGGPHLSLGSLIFSATCAALWGPRSDEKEMAAVDRDAVMRFLRPVGLTDKTDEDQTWRLDPQMFVIV